MSIFKSNQDCLYSSQPWALIFSPQYYQLLLCSGDDLATTGTYEYSTLPLIINTKRLNIKGPSIESDLHLRESGLCGKCVCDKHALFKLHGLKIVTIIVAKVYLKLFAFHLLHRQLHRYQVVPSTNVLKIFLSMPVAILTVDVNRRTTHFKFHA